VSEEPQPIPAAPSRIARPHQTTLPLLGAEEPPAGEQLSLAIGD